MMNETAIPQPFATPMPAPSAPSEPEPDVFETSSWLARVTSDETMLGTARRAGIGLALTLPFSIVLAIPSHAAIDARVVAIFALPIGLALIALVGIAASTLGISLVSAPLEPEDAADVASRGLFRTGILLAGLTPLTALWIASGRVAEMMIASTLVLLVAGVGGIGSISVALVRRVALPSGEVRLGALGVALLFGLFAFVVGVRLWFGTGQTFFYGVE